MTRPRDSPGTERTPGDTTPSSDGESHALPGNSRMQELASSHLERAIDADGSSEKDYHIRSALQALVFAEETRPD